MSEAVNRSCGCLAAAAVLRGPELGRRRVAVAVIGFAIGLLLALLASTRAAVADERAAADAAGESRVVPDSAGRGHAGRCWRVAGRAGVCGRGHAGRWRRVAGRAGVCGRGHAGRCRRVAGRAGFRGRGHARRCRRVLARGGDLVRGDGASVERSRASASSADAGDREDRAGDGQRDRSPDGVSSSEREDDTFGSAARIAVRVTAGRDAGAPANTAEAAHQIDVAESSDTDELAGSESATDPPTDLAERSEAVDNPVPVAASVPPPAPPAPAAPPEPLGSPTPALSRAPLEQSTPAPLSSGGAAGRPSSSLARGLCRPDCAPQAPASRSSRGLRHGPRFGRPSELSRRTLEPALATRRRPPRAAAPRGAGAE